MNKNLLKKLTYDRGLKDSSIAAYTSVLNKIATDFNRKVITPDFVSNNIDKILAFYQSTSHSKQISIYTVILLVLSPKEKKKPSKKNKPIYDKVNTLLINENNDYNKKKENQLKTKKEEDNWVELDTIKTFIKDNEKRYIKIYKSEPSIVNYFNLQKFLIMRLYTDIPPRRLCYSDMIYRPLKDFQKLDSDQLKRNNYFALPPPRSMKDAIFFFGSDNTKSKDTTVGDGIEVIIPNGIMKLLNTMRYHAMFDRYLLYNTKMKKLNKSSLSKLIQSIFKEFFKKNIGASMLRKIYISDYFKNDIPLKERKRVSQIMNHSIGVSMTHYQKILPENK